MKHSKRMPTGRTDIVLYTFDVYYCGWECDTKGHIMEASDGSKYLRMTSHGTPYVGTTRELEELIESYRTVMANTIHALNLLRGAELQLKEVRRDE